jgi:hypothetical protein
MLDRRQGIRRRVYDGRVAFDERHAPMACLVRNFSPIAKVELASNPCCRTRYLSIARKGILVWRRGDEAGLAPAI